MARDNNNASGGDGVLIAESSSDARGLVLARLVGVGRGETNETIIVGGQYNTWLSFTCLMISRRDSSSITRRQQGICVVDLIQPFGLISAHYYQIYWADN